MKFVKAVDIWKLTQDEIKKLAIGQWVFAGDVDNKGQFLGIKKSGSVVVAWYENAKASKNFNQYKSKLREYATAN